MTTAGFLLAASALAVGTFLIRILGVRLGALMRTRGSGASGSGNPEDSPVRVWFDRSATVLIAAVCVTSTLYDGQDFAGWARVLGVSAGALAAVCRVPLLGSVAIGMAVCAGARLLGLD